jgi:hypothetical protein
MTKQTKERVEFIKKNPNILPTEVAKKFKLSRRQAARLIQFAFPNRKHDNGTNKHSLRYDIPAGYTIDSFQTSGKTLIINFIKK